MDDIDNMRVGMTGILTDNDYVMVQTARGARKIPVAAFRKIVNDTATGARGKRGKTGAQGNQGNPGSAVHKGDTGSTGLTGARGADGKDGLNGTNGIDGKQGAAGIDGKNGKDGINGLNGSNGLAGAPGVMDPKIYDKLFKELTEKLTPKMDTGGRSSAPQLRGLDGLDASFNYSDTLPSAANYPEGALYFVTI